MRKEEIEKMLVDAKITRKNLYKRKKCGDINFSCSMSGIIKVCNNVIELCKELLN